MIGRQRIIDGKVSGVYVNPNNRGSFDVAATYGGSTWREMNILTYESALRRGMELIKGLMRGKKSGMESA